MLAQFSHDGQTCGQGVIGIKKLKCKEIIVRFSEKIKLMKRIVAIHMIINGEKIPLCKPMLGGY